MTPSMVSEVSATFVLKDDLAAIAGGECPVLVGRWQRPVQR